MRRFRTMLLIAVAVIIGVRVYTWNAASLAGNQFPMPFGYGAGVVLSGSMEPALSVDDLIIAKESEDYKMGDMVIFQDGSTVVVHRVVELDETSGMMQTKGDANQVLDEPIGTDLVKGKVVAVIPSVGLAVRLLKTPEGMILLLAAAVLLVEFSYRKEKQADEEQLEKIKEEIRKLREEEE